MKKIKVYGIAYSYLEDEDSSFYFDRVSLKTTKAKRDKELVAFQHSNAFLQHREAFECFESELVLENETSTKQEDMEFADEIYKMYPAKCPVRNAYLGKTRKDKQKIIKLLKTYSKDEIRAVVKFEVDTKYGKQMMQNFSTFLNNLPDPNEIGIANQPTQPKNEELIIDGVKYE